MTHPEIELGRQEDVVERRRAAVVAKYSACATPSAAVASVTGITVRESSQHETEETWRECDGSDWAASCQW